MTFQTHLQTDKGDIRSKEKSRFKDDVLIRFSN